MTPRDSIEMADIPPPVPEKDADALELGEMLRAKAVSQNLHDVKLQSQRYDSLLFSKIVVVFSLWMAMVAFNLSGSFSCTADLLTPCLPQFSMRIRTQDQKGKESLHSIQKGLEVLSYFAGSVEHAEEKQGDQLALMVEMWLQFNHPHHTTTTTTAHSQPTNLGGLDSPVRRFDMLLVFDLVGGFSSWVTGKNVTGAIQTFSEKSTFQFNFNGFCRYDSNVGHTAGCLYARGLDVFSLIVRDIGYQLALEAKSPDPTSLAYKMVRIYQRMLMSLNKKYTEAEKDPKIAAKYDMEEFHQVRLMRNAKRFGKYSSIILMVAIVLLIVTTIIAGNMLLSYLFEHLWWFTRFQTNMNLITKVLVILSLVFVLMEILVLFGEIYLHHRLRKLFTRLPIAYIYPNFGFLFTILNIVFGITQVVLHIRMLQRHIKL